MAEQRKAMQCPACGSTMNHHSVKVNYAAGTDWRQQSEAEPGGILEEIHTCPRCGRTESRPESKTEGRSA
jgi:ribosomal protein S27AE